MQTRGARLRNDERLADFDLDPFHSNRDRFQQTQTSVAPVATSTTESTSRPSTLTTLPPTPARMSDFTSSIESYFQNQQSGHTPSIGFSVPPARQSTPYHRQLSQHPANVSRNPFLVPTTPAPVPFNPPTPPPTQNFDTDALFAKFNKQSSNASTRSNKRNPSDFKIERFSEKNLLTADGATFHSWKCVQELLLETVGWSGHLDRTDPIPLGNEEYELWKQTDLQVKSQLAMNMEFSLFGELKHDISTAADLWDKVIARFENRSLLTQTAAEERLRCKRIQSSESMPAHIAELRRLKGELLNTGGAANAGTWQAILMRSLSGIEKWRTAMILGNSYTDPEAYIAMLLSMDPDLDTKESALQARGSKTKPRTTSPSRRTSEPCSNCGRGYHTVADCFAPGGGAISRRPPGYKVPYHMRHKEKANLATELESLEKQKTEMLKQLETHRAQLAQASNRTSESANLAKVESHDNRQYAMLVDAFPTINTACWLLDSGASSHMTNNRTNFSAYMDVKPISIETAKKGLTLSAVGLGTVTASFVFKNETHTYPIHNVLYVPELSHNLLSLAKLDERGVKLFTDDGRAELLRKGPTGLMVFGEGVKCENQWVMSLTIVKEAAHLVNTHADTHQPIDVYHQRFNHLNVERIKELERGQHVSGMNITKCGPTCKCATCITSKMPALPAKSKPVLRAKGPGDIIHVDLEFMHDRSYKGSTISLKFIDEFSNYVVPHVLASKDGETIAHLWSNLISFYLTQFGIRIKALHSDNGTEFVNHHMQSINEKHGIEHHLTVAYRHEMNGRAERMNRTASDAVRSMLSFAGLPRAMWAEAVETWAYVHNRTGTSSVDGKTPYEVMHGTKPAVDHIRTFGSIAYTRVPPELRSKLDPKAELKILIGYDQDAAYRLFDPKTRKVSYSRDAIFDEFNSFTKPDLTPVYSPDGDTSASITEIQESASESAPAVPRVPELRRSSRIAEQAHVASVQGIPIPRNAAEALRSSNSNDWYVAMQYEISKLREHGVFEVVEHDPTIHLIQGMWVFTIKEEADSSLGFKARWVVRGDSQIPGLEFGETYAASGDYTAARTVVALSVHPSSTLTTIDITSAFLHSPLEETNLYAAYPSGFSIPGFKRPVCHLLRATYGLRQAPHAWNSCFTEKLKLEGFKKLVTAPSVFYRSDLRGESIVGTHVDDCTASCKSTTDDRAAESVRFKQDVSKHFQFKEKYPRERANLLGLTVYYNEQQHYVKLSCSLKTDRMVVFYGLQDTIPARTPMVENALTLFRLDASELVVPPPWPYAHLVGELLWIGTNIRIDIAFAVNVLARFMTKPKQIHWEAALRVVSYLKGTRDLGIVYRAGGEERPVGYSDSDWSRDLSDCKSVGGYVFMLNGGPIAWRSRKQNVVATSTAEAEYRAVSSSACEAIWFRHFFQEINRSFGDSPSIIHIDNQAALQMTQNPVYLSKTKHIDIPVHHIRDEVAKGRIALIHVKGTENPADILTKPLNPLAHEKCVKLLGMS